MAQILEKYDDPELPAVVQPVWAYVPWAVMPKAEDFDASVANAAPLPVVTWAWQFWEEDLRLDLTQYLYEMGNLDVGDKIRDLPANYLTVLYRNIFEGKIESFDAVLMTRASNELIDVPEALPAYWVAYWLSMYMYHQRSSKDKITPEDKYQMKVINDINRAVSYMLNKGLTGLTAYKANNYLIICNTKSVAERITLFVKRDLLSDYLDSGKTLTDLGVDFFNKNLNPKKGTDF